MIVMPIYKIDSCFNWYFSFMDGHQNDILYKGSQTTQTVIFITVNYIEIVGLFIVYKGLIKVGSNKLNIRNEIKYIVFVWVSFSILYFNAK